MRRAKEVSSLRVSFTDCRPLQCTERVTKDDAGESEEDGRAMREVGKHERVGDTTVLVNDDKVRHLVRSAGVGELLHDVVTAVDAGRVGDDEAELLRLWKGKERKQRMSAFRFGKADTAREDEIKMHVTGGRERKSGR